MVVNTFLFSILFLAASFQICCHLLQPEKYVRNDKNAIMQILEDICYYIKFIALNNLKICEEMHVTYL